LKLLKPALEKSQSANITKNKNKVSKQNARLYFNKKHNLLIYNNLTFENVFYTFGNTKTFIKQHNLLIYNKLQTNTK